MYGTSIMIHRFEGPGTSCVYYCSILDLHLNLIEVLGIAASAIHTYIDICVGNLLVL